jgi:hypothetical protein
VTDLIYLGTDTQALVEVPGLGVLTVRMQNARKPRPEIAIGGTLHLEPDAASVRLLTDCEALHGR